MDEVIAAINSAPQDIIWMDESPLWYRPQYLDEEMFRKDAFTQVVGHTPVDEIYEKNGVISTDVFSTFPDGQQIGESAMVVIDTESREYEKIKV